MLYPVENLQRFFGKGAEETLGAKVTSQAVFDATQAVGRVHGRSSVAAKAIRVLRVEHRLLGNTKCWPET